MPSNNTPAFQRRQEEQRQQQRRAEAQAAQARVQAHRERATASILDQLRPLQEQQHIRQWGEARSNALMFGADLDTDAARIFHNPAHYTAGVDPISCRDSESGRGGFTLLTGSRGYEELDRAIQERIRQERARPTPSYDMESTVARYGHLLTVADQQRLGYVAPGPPASVDGQEMHTLSYPGVRLRNPSGSRPSELSEALNHTFGDTDSSTSILDMITGPTLMNAEVYKWGLRSKGTQPVANFLAPTPGPTDQEWAAADEWLKNSPWG